MSGPLRSTLRLLFPRATTRATSTPLSVEAPSSSSNPFLKPEPVSVRTTTSAALTATRSPPTAASLPSSSSTSTTLPTANTVNPFLAIKKRTSRPQRQSIKPSLLTPAQLRAHREKADGNVALIVENTLAKRKRREKHLDQVRRDAERKAATRRPLSEEEVEMAKVWWEGLGKEEREEQRRIACLRLDPVERERRERRRARKMEREAKRAAELETEPLANTERYY